MGNKQKSRKEGSDDGQLIDKTAALEQALKVEGELRVKMAALEEALKEERKAKIEAKSAAVEEAQKEEQRAKEIEELKVQLERSESTV